jgi:predicted transcriptional regulator of viral defense system
MARSKFRARSAAAWALAQRQHGVVTRRQLLALGFTRDAVDHRLETGRLRLLTRGVYSVGLPRGTTHQRWMAAVLACGEDAALSHGSAAALWGVAAERTGRVDVSVRRESKHLRPGMQVRRRPSLPAGEVTAHEGIPVTTPARTLVDLATQLEDTALERAINEADKRDLIDPEALREHLSNFAGEPGVRALRTLLDRHTFLLSDSDLEIFFRPIARSAGLPQPLSKQIVSGVEVDFNWPGLGLVVETDGLRYHRTPAAQTRDRVRDQAHVAAGLTVLRFTHWQVRHEPARVRRVLEQTASHLRR